MMKHSGYKAILLKRPIRFQNLIGLFCIQSISKDFRNIMKLRVKTDLS